MFSGIPIEEITESETADGQKVKPLPTWYLIVKNNKTIFESKDKLRRNREYQNKYFRHPGVYLQEYTMTEDDVKHSRELKTWDRGYTHAPLDIIKQDNELAMAPGRIVWPWETDAERELRQEGKERGKAISFLDKLTTGHVI